MALTDHVTYDSLLTTGLTAPYVPLLLLMLGPQTDWPPPGSEWPR